MGGTQSFVDYYSPDYFSARERFVAACERLGFDLHTLPIEAPSPNAQQLTIDVAVAGSAKPTSAIVVSSGVHGVEGFFGSAVQLAFLEGLPPNWQPPNGAALILLHALNPFGFAWQRRFNEDNVDLNRNFLLTGEEYAGAPPLCDAFRRVMSPDRHRTRFGFWTARMALLAARHGVRSFWETLPVGQYEFPDWLFFGGRARSQSACLLDQLLPTFLDSTAETIHLDFHTGLGRWGDCQLLLSELEGAENAGWWKNHFGTDNVSESDGARGPYQMRGGLGPWLRARFPSCRYRYATAEFGTYSPARVIGALAEELRWHAQLGANSSDHWSRRRLAETFVPRSRRWRTKSLDTGLSLIRRAAEVLWRPAGSTCPILATA